MASATPIRVSLAVQYGVSARTLPTRGTLRRWAKAALERDATVTVRFVGTKEGRRLNRDFRARDYATNVLTFVYDEPAGLAGDLVLCTPVLRREAREAGIPFLDHCAHLVVHGLLHLQGHDHPNARRAKAMEAIETRILAGLRIADPYAARPQATSPALRRGEHRAA